MHLKRSLLRQINAGPTRYFLASCILSVGGCTFVVPPPDQGEDGGYNNTTDPTNKSASYVGADACRACHSGISDQHEIHGHSHKLKKVEGGPPIYPVEGDRAGVPDPPGDFDWSEISYVIGGYTRKARFIDNEGFILTTGLEAIPTQWNLSFPANGTIPGFSNYEAAAVTPKPYDFSCFQCHTTGALAQDEDFPQFQENRPGFIGTWEEAGVQCEACHGPGSNHIPNPEARDIYVGNSADNCGKCHTRGDDPNIIIAKDGYINHHEQWPELLASGGHSNFSCVTCHDPHRGTNYDRSNAIRNECTACHANQTMAIHEGFTFVRGDYSEELTCVSCHMPFVTRSATSATTEVVGDLGRMGDTRTHIFRINTEPVDRGSFFTADGNAVAKDDQGRGAVTLDFVCFRCHNGIGNAGAIDSLELASGVASGMHSITRPAEKQMVRAPQGQ